tara:strand:+ start:26 stop:727 length:702 start_codon:yes stop_codon:yes gene_type:complete
MGMGASLKVLDLFSGTGAFSFGLEKAGHKTIGFCDNDPKAQEVIRKHWPGVPLYSDILLLNKTLEIESEIICGGFPCQPFSSASHGKIVAKDLWPEMFRVISIFKPKWVIAENVQRSPMLTAKKDLKSLGYKSELRNIKASQCGAPHRRSRWWLIAHTYHKSKFSLSLNAEVEMLPKLCEGLWGPENYSRAIRVPNGFTDRMDRHRLRLLGNAVLPQIPEAIGRAIANFELIK